MMLIKCNRTAVTGGQTFDCHPVDVTTELTTPFCIFLRQASLLVSTTSLKLLKTIFSFLV